MLKAGGVWSALLLACCVLASPLHAQCERWLAGEGQPGTSGFITCSTVWDRDGDGPLAPVLVVGGDFTTAGGYSANRVAMFDGVRWSSLGSGLNSRVNAMAVLPDNRLVVGGFFTSAGGAPASRVAAFDGAAWSALGAGVSGAVESLLVMPSGDLIAGGVFTSAGGNPAGRIARWSGGAWSAIGAGFDSTVTALAVSASGELVAGGSFLASGAAPLNRVAKWDGAAWQPMGTGFGGTSFTINVRDFVLLPGGDLVAAGSFQTADGASAINVARWNGSSWSSMASSFSSNNTSVAALELGSDGSLYAGGFFSHVDGVYVSNIARWNGAAWTPVQQGLGAAVNTLTTLPDGRLLVGGAFTSVNSTLTISGIARAWNVLTWDGSAWAPVGLGLGETLSRMTIDSAGRVTAIGSFTHAGGELTAFIARWENGAWSPFPIWRNDGNLRCVAASPDGSILLGGGFTDAGAPSYGLARWTGASWNPISTGINFGGTVLVIRPLSATTFLIGGNFTSAGGTPAEDIALWNGSAFVPLGSGVGTGAANSNIQAIDVLPNGDVVVGGFFSTAGGGAASNVARWNGSSWLPLGSGAGGIVSALLARPDGSIVAGGAFATAGGSTVNRIARWDGSGWNSLGGGVTGTPSPGVSALLALPSGDIIATGRFTSAGSTPALNIARWNGAAWAAMGSGLGVADTSAGGNTLALHTSGEVLVGGSFITAGGQVSSEFARWTSTGLPWFVVQPAPTVATCGSPEELWAALAPGYDALSARWQLEVDGVWTDITDGPLVVGGRAVGTCSGSQTTRLVVTALAGFDPVPVRCVVSNACGEVPSGAAQLSAAPCCGSADFNGDGDLGTDADIEAFFACLAGTCCDACGSADFNADGDTGTDTDIEAFFRVLGGGNC